MLKYAIIIFLNLASLSGFAQGASQKQVLPAIDLTLTDGERFTNHHLKQGSTILVYFSPDCGHCKEFLTDLLQREKLIAGKQILLATFVEVNTLKSFEEAMGIRKFPNIKTGTEGDSYRIARSLAIRKFPYVALYDSSRKLIRSFEGEQPMGQIVEAIGKL